MGHPAAMEKYAGLLYTGSGVPENRAKAVTWYLAAAEKGNATAQYSLAVCPRKAMASVRI